jgi:hypothetical protein
MLNLETADHLRQSSDDGYTEPDLASALSHHAAVVLCLRHSSSGVHHVLAIVPSRLDRTVLEPVKDDGNG